MIRIQNDCCSCAVPGYPCIGERCELLHAKHYFCDECGDEVYPGELYWFDGEQLCISCIESRLEVVRYE